jgi:hypothetical protein
MKIALCFSGQPRSFKTGYEYYKKNLLEKYDVDVFFHTWADSNVDEVADLYDPKGYVISDRLDKDLINAQYPRCADAVKYPAIATVSSFYSIYESSRIKSQYELNKGFKYDWVIRTRFDYALNITIPFNDLSDKKLYVPHCRMSPAHDFCNDQFAFSNSVNMNKYMSTYMFLNHYYDDLGVVMNGEDMLAANLKYHKLIGDNMIYVNMNNPFPPGKYNGTWHSLIRDDMENWNNG